jgi:hypothetical protein
MDDVVICAQNLAKRYKLGATLSHDTLRERGSGEMSNVGSVDPFSLVE